VFAGREVVAVFGRRTVRRTLLGEFFGALRPHSQFAVLTILAAAPLAVALTFVPAVVVLPTISLAAIALGGLAALLAWTRGARRQGERITMWDISGALVFIGCAAGMLSRPDNVLQLFGTVMVR
jgi:hypothetical protein